MNLYNRIRAILFDVDNTLIASDEYAKETILETLAQLATEGMHMEVPTDVRFGYVFRQNLPFSEIFDQLFHDSAELVLTRYRQIAKDRPHIPTSFAIETIARFKKAGLVIGLVTNRKRLLEERLTEAGFDIKDFHFAHQPQSDELRKPHPRSLDLALADLRTHGIERHQVVLIGDHLDDMNAARANDMDFIAVLSGGLTREDFTVHGLAASAIVEHLGNLETAAQQLVLARVYKESLTCVSALDGRHALVAKKLVPYFSEYALHKRRIMVEAEHLICLDETFPRKVLPRNLFEREKAFLRNLGETFTEANAFEILQYDHLGRDGMGPTEHDVKSCELWMREKFRNTTLEDIAPFVHIFLTSEDVNNLAYKMMIADYVNDLFIPAMFLITDRLEELIRHHASDPVMSRTHVQPASPTTFGKIFLNYLIRLQDGLHRLCDIPLTGKCNGAVGNYNAFTAACPDLHWMHYSKTFVNRIGFEVELNTDQRGTHADVIRVFQALQELNNVMRDIATDLSLYAGFKTMYFTKTASHVGSSTMPHKVNPWMAEVAESNCKKSNALINLFANELDVSRLQRDLSDHDHERSYGEAFGYNLVAVQHLHLALTAVRPDTAYAQKELEAHPEIVTEAIQTVLRHLGKPDAYDQLKNAFRGEHPTFADIHTFVISLDLPSKQERHLLNLIEPGAYIGLAVQFVEEHKQTAWLFRQPFSGRKKILYSHKYGS